MSGWRRVSRKDPCPICGRPDWCTVSPPIARCMRVESLQASSKGGWIHDLDGCVAQQWERQPVVNPNSKTDEELNAIWRPKVDQWRERGRSELSRLALSLGVALRSLVELEAGWDGKAWTFPEKNASGEVIGVTRRFVDGGKRCARGSRRGICYGLWQAHTGPILIVEGASDVAAGITMGISTIGRPNDLGGAEAIAMLLGGIKRDIVVIGERDQKEDGRWPGLEGCKKVAASLRRLLRRNVGAKLLPDNAKDLRSWLVSRHVDVGSKIACFRAKQILTKHL